MTDEHGIGTYPVGLMMTATRAWHLCRVPRRDRRRAASFVYLALRGDLRYLRRQAHDRNWRAVRNHFNGFLAEWHYPPTDPAYARPSNCGRGLTRRAALRRLGQNIVVANLSDQERAR